MMDIVRVFLDKGYQISPDAASRLASEEDSLSKAGEVLEAIERHEKKPQVVSIELLESLAREAGPDSVFNIFEIQPTDWDFAGVNTHSMTHGLHPYPARMIPQIACRLIDNYSKAGDIVLDPFCGSGTVIVESQLMRAHQSGKPKPARNAIGIDINPFAAALAKVKSTPIEPLELEKATGEFLKDVDEKIYRAQKEPYDVPIPSKDDFPNLEHWFKPYVVRELSVIRGSLADVQDNDIRDFLKICFSLTARKVSNIYNPGDTFIKRLSASELKRYRPEVPNTFRETVIQAQNKMREFSRACSRDTWTQIVLADTRNLPLDGESVNAIVTSPPYGEERSTISYTRWTKLSSYWLGFTPEIVRKHERASLGASYGESLYTPSKTLNNILEKIAKRNSGLAHNAASFLRDYSACLLEINRVLRKSGACCIVVGDRSLLRVRVPMDKVTTELATEAGFSLERVFYRAIPTKAIPWTVAKGETIAKENVLIFRKT